MNNKRLLDVVGTILLAAGFFLAFLPHAVHTAVGLDEETSHLKHVITGMITVVIGLGILVFNNKALKLPTMHKKI